MVFVFLWLTVYNRTISGSIYVIANGIISFFMTWVIFYCNIPFPSPGYLPNPRIEPWSPELQADSIPSEPPEKIPIFYCIHVSHLYPLIYWWMFRLLHVLAIVNSAAMNSGVHISLWIIDSSGYMPRIGIAGSILFSIQLYQFTFPPTV